MKDLKLNGFHYDDNVVEKFGDIAEAKTVIKENFIRSKKM